jgi:RNA polymerase sigma-70 factor, ECF subfamily
MTGQEREGASFVSRREESRWVARIAVGDEDALAEAYREHGDRIYGLAFGILRSIADAEDVVQDVFVGLPEKARTFEGHGTFASWLYRVAVRTAMTRVYSDRRRSRLLREMRGWKRWHEPGDAITRIALERAYASLQPNYRAVLWLKGREGWSHAEIAEALGITVDLSSQWLHRGREALQKALREVT